MSINIQAYAAAVAAQAKNKNKEPEPRRLRKPDLNTPQGLAAYAASLGLDEYANPILETEKKLSFLQRLSAGLSSFNPANAISTGMTMHSLGAGIKEYGKDVAGGIGSAITGKDYVPDRKYYKDVINQMGGIHTGSSIVDGVATWGLGFLGDVFLDPSTYFGTAFLKAGVAIERAALGEGADVLMKLASKASRVALADSPGLARAGQILAHPVAEAAGAVGATALKGIGKVSPEAAAGVIKTVEGIKDTFGNLFVAAYKSSKGMRDWGLSLFNHLNIMKNQISKETIAEFRAAFGDAFVERLPEYMERSVVGKLGEHEMRKMMAEELSKKQTATLSTLKKMLQATERFLGKKVRLQDLDSIGRVNAARLENAGYSITTLAHASKIGEFAGASFVPEINKIAKILGITPEKAGELSDVANGILEFAARENAGYTKQVGEILDKMRDVKTWQIDFKAAGEYGTKLALEGADPLMAKLYREQKLKNMEAAVKSGILYPWHNYYTFRRDGRVLSDGEAFKDIIMAESVNKKGLRVGSQGYLKQFKNLVDPKDIIQNPVEAESLVRGEMATDLAKKEAFSEAVARWGKPLDAYEDSHAGALEALKDGYRLISTKGTAGGLPLGTKVGWMKEADFQFLNGQVNNQYPAISALARAMKFDAVQGLFKRSVTVPFLPFHVRNFVSGMVQNFEEFGIQALNPKVLASAWKIAKEATQGRALTGTMKYKGVETSLEELFKPFFELFTNDPRQFEEMSRAFETGILPETNQFKDIISKGTLKKTVSPKSFLSQDSAVFKGGRAVSNFIEVQQKAVAYISALSMGQSTEQALERAAAAGFNYAAVTPFESQIMKRLIPFYSFTRKNIELQLRTLTQNPQRVNAILRFMDFGKDPSKDERQGLPAFLKESLGFKIEDLPNGLKLYLSNFGTPIEQFTDLVGGNVVLKTISMMSPVLKVPIEIGIGRDSFRETDLKDTYSANDLSILPQFLKDALDMTPVQKDVLEKQSNGKLKKIGEETRWVADPVKLLIFRSLFTSRGFTYLDKMLDGDVTGFAKIANLATGVKTYRVNPEAVIAVDEKNKERALIDLLERRANLKVFTRPFIPK